MRVAIDARDLNREHLRGMGRCLWELIARGSKYGVHWEVLADRPDLPLHLPKSARITVHNFECRGHRFHTWEQLGFPEKAARLKVDLLHGPSMRIPWWQPVPTIVTLHDTIPWQGNEPCWGRGWYTDKIIPRAFCKCAAMITVSETSKKDILNLWPGLSDKLHVIYNGVGDEYLTASPTSLSSTLRAIGIRQPYFLYWGGTIPRKRLKWAIEVISKLADPSVQLVLCGVERSAHEQIREELKPEFRKQVLLAPFIPEAEMPGLYQNAVAVLYPTLYEGFGLPALEAQACGTPVLFSPLGSLAEFQGPGAIVLPPEDLSAWVGVCSKQLETRRANPNPNEQARTWAGQFSWDVCVSRSVELYSRTLSSFGWTTRSKQRISK